MHLRNDVGGLWENFCLAERMKLNNNKRKFVNMWFWRTYDQKKIDYIEEYGGTLNAFEFKFKQVKVQKAPKDFVDNYSDIHYKIINRENFLKFLEDYARDNRFFEMERIPNEETLQAIRDVEEGRTFEAKDVDDLF